MGFEITHVAHSAEGEDESLLLSSMIRATFPRLEVVTGQERWGNISERNRNGGGGGRLQRSESSSSLYIGCGDVLSVVAVLPVELHTNSRLILI